MSALVDRAKKNPILYAAVAAALVVAVVAGSIAIYNFTNGEAWEARALEAEDELEISERNLGLAREELTELQGERARLSSEVGTLRSEADAVAARAAELETLSAEVAEREAAVTATEQQIAANTITEGMWTVGIDIEPGTYRTTEAVSSGSCYWGIYRSGTNGGDIIENDIVNGGFPTVTLSEGQDFSTQRCGSWVKQ
jgi:hypothetical protein